MQSVLVRHCETVNSLSPAGPSPPSRPTWQVPRQWLCSTRPRGRGPASLRLSPHRSGGSDGTMAAPLGTARRTASPNYAAGHYHQAEGRSRKEAGPPFH